MLGLGVGYLDFILNVLAVGLSDTNVLYRLVACHISGTGDAFRSGSPLVPAIATLARREVCTYIPAMLGTSAGRKNIPRLLAADDPAPFSIHNGTGRARFLMVCDHASNAVPWALDSLGISSAQLERHIGWDIGAGDLTRRLADTLDATALLGGYSRLVIDLNRALDDPTSIPEISDGTIVVGNHGLSTRMRTARANEIFHPYHEAVTAEVDRHMSAGAVPALVSIHSYTPVAKGKHRPWDVGVTWNRDPRLPIPFMAGLGTAADIQIGDNLPFSARNGYGYTCAIHATKRGLPELLIEIRQDLLDGDRRVEEWAGILTPVLADVLSHEDIYRVEHFT